MALSIEGRSSLQVNDGDEKVEGRRFFVSNEQWLEVEPQVVMGGLRREYEPVPAVEKKDTRKESLRLLTDDEKKVLEFLV